MQTVVDELKFDRQYEMSLVEFYECIARLAEIASLHPVSAPLKDLLTTWSTYEKRYTLPLHIKIEAFIKRLYEKGRMSQIQRDKLYSGKMKSLFNR